MNANFVLDDFIREHVTRRRESLLAADLQRCGGELRARLTGRQALVIGGAGTIGASFIRAMLRYPVAGVCVVDTNENGLTELVRDLRSTDGLAVPDRLLTYPVSFGDRVFEKILECQGPFEIVANFAAHKHVRSEKDVFAIEAMIENNVFRARGLLERLAAQPPERFFCVSTDKAANPVNVMGASKKLMEDLILSYVPRLPVTTARFANVAFSNGSLPQGFLERLARRQPWSCPNDIRRYFVSPAEAGEICLSAAMLGRPGEILFPKLDPDRDMLSFADMAVALLHALGLEPDVCATEAEARRKAAVLGARPAKYPVYFFPSDTSGEKPTEEFVAAGESADLERFAALGVVRARAARDPAALAAILARLEALFASGSAGKADVVAALSAYLPTFQHIEKGRNLDQRM
jgi:FlaA1/EpsC-like NDP-sugar epimerase